MKKKLCLGITPLLLPQRSRLPFLTACPEDFELASQLPPLHELIPCDVSFISRDIQREGTSVNKDNSMKKKVKLRIRSLSNLKHSYEKYTG